MHILCYFRLWNQMWTHIDSNKKIFTTTRKNKKKGGLLLHHDFWYLVPGTRLVSLLRLYFQFQNVHKCLDEHAR